MLDVTRLQLSEKHARWLEDARKIPCELAAEMGVVSMGPNVAFEYRRNGKLLWRQERIPIRNPDGTQDKEFRCWAPDGRTLKQAGIELSFWQEDDLIAASSPEVPRIITEGQFDACALRLAGFPFVGSVPNGARDKLGEGDIDPAHDNQFVYLWAKNEATGAWSLRGGLGTCKAIIIATDADKPGKTLREELALRLGRDRCWFVTYPEGVIDGKPIKDANDVLIKYGAEKGVELLQKMIAAAQPIVANRLMPLSQIPTVKREFVHCGWTALRPHLRISRPALMVVTGPPNHGKSQWTIALACNLALYHDWKIAVVQFEDDVDRMREDLTRYFLAKQDKPNPETWTNADRTAAATWIDQHFLTISPDESENGDRMDIGWLRESMKEAAQRHGCQMFVVDPWNEVEHLWGKGQTETQYLNDAIRELKRLSRRYQLLLTIVAHPDKASGSQPDIEEWKLYAISGGQTWNNKADYGVILLRKEGSPNESYVKIAKTRRHATMGQPATIIMKYSPLKATYEAANHVK